MNKQEPCRVALIQFNSRIFVLLPKKHDIRAIISNKDLTMKNLLSILALAMCLGIVSCGEDYDADTAQSPYTPAPGKRLVASVKTTFFENGGENIHEHRFTYDAKGRIKTINSNIVIYTPDVVDNNGFIDPVVYKCNMTSSANYFYRGEELEVAYTISTDYPERPDKNRISSSSNYGVFNSNGVLGRFSQASFEYSATRLDKAYADGDISIAVHRTTGDNVTGYKKTVSTTGEVLEDKSGLYHYHPKENRTNFDFSAYFGYWGVEQCVPMIARTYRAPYQLAAFGMLGATCRHLPWGYVGKDADGKQELHYGKWTFDESGVYPLSYVDPDERITTEITYYE